MHAHAIESVELLCGSCFCSESGKKKGRVIRKSVLGFTEHVVAAADLRHALPQPFRCSIGAVLQGCLIDWVALFVSWSRRGEWSCTWGPLLRRFLRSEDDQVASDPHHTCVTAGTCLTTSRNTCVRTCPMSCYTEGRKIACMHAPTLERLGCDTQMYFLKDILQHQILCPGSSWQCKRTGGLGRGQVELLLTFEEFCGEEGVFESTGDKGSTFAPVFAQVLKALYDKDIVEEKAFLDWADEKEHAEEHERAFLAKASKFITWLREAEEEDEDDDEDESEEDSD
eukprot:jgi/Botrbrau1/3143/Bobra.0070s0110.1